MSALPERLETKPLYELRHGWIETKAFSGCPAKEIIPSQERLPHL